MTFQPSRRLYRITMISPQAQIWERKVAFLEAM